MKQSILQSYQTQQIMTASPAKLVALLYDRAATLLNDVVQAIEQGDIQRRCDANRTAIDVISQLWSTLDLDRGGEIAQNLSQLYGFMMRRMGDIDLQNDAQAARDVIALLEPLRKSWHQLAAQSSGAAAATSSQAPRPSADPSAQPQGVEPQRSDPQRAASKPFSLSA